MNMKLRNRPGPALVEATDPSRRKLSGLQA